MLCAPPPMSQQGGFGLPFDTNNPHWIGHPRFYANRHGSRRHQLYRGHLPCHERHANPRVLLSTKPRAKGYNQMGRLLVRGILKMNSNRSSYSKIGLKNKSPKKALFI